MRNKFYVSFLVSFIFIFGFLIIKPNFVFAQNINTTLQPEPTAEKFNAKAGTYELINPIGNISSIKDQDPGGLSNFFNLLIKIAIALAGAMAVVVIIINGIQYMGTDSVWEKGETRFKIGAAIGGLILLLTSYIILFTINPDLVNIKIGITKGTEGEWILPDDIEGSRPSTLQVGKYPAGVYCPQTGTSSSVKKIAQSFSGKVTYAIGNEGGKGEPGPNGTILLDCSGFVTTVLKCAGFKPGTDFIDGGTANIFDSKSQLITTVKGNTINGVALKAGDVVGYLANDKKGKKWGHILIFTGSSFVESRGGTAGRKPGGNTLEKTNTAEELFNKDYIKRVRRIP